MPNRLVHTTSPYLLQHAHQPVDWRPWEEEALQKAQQEDKPLLVSIGYAACHWCHVMAQESFEDKEVAKVMNVHFICIKVDREERPDVDQVYVAALQAMGIDVGWPLHVFLLPNQKPFYGGLYFPMQAWKRVLEEVVKAFQTHRAQLETSAFQFTQALQESEARQPGLMTATFTHQELYQYFHQLYQGLDHEQGGLKGTPKFPMPSVGSFLLHYYWLMHDERALAQLNLTLERMAYGGIYDQLGGGFARYATDTAWSIPHFEKMLYDNGQLLSLYAQAYAITKKALYKRVIQETVAFLEAVMMHTEGGFYSTLDADSEGIEGKFYTWTQAAVEKVLGKQAPLLIKHFNITSRGNWKQGTNVLYQTGVAHAAPVVANIDRARQLLFESRERRQQPTVDDKIITSWNGMVLQGLVDAYNVLGEARLLALALKNAAFIEKYLLQGDRLWHSYSKGKTGAPGYLEDYAWMAQALISLYQATLEEHWLYTASALVQYTMDHFYDAQTGLFYFVEQREAKLIARQKEIFDNVIPSSNAVMAHSLFMLGTILDKAAYTTTAMQMLCNVTERIKYAPLYMSHWATLYMQQLQPIIVVAIVGQQAKAWASIVKQHYPMGVVLLGAERASKLPLLANKQTGTGKTTIYVCQQGICQAPMHSIEEALKELVKLIRTFV